MEKGIPVKLVVLGKDRVQTKLKLEGLVDTILQDNPKNYIKNQLSTGPGQSDVVIHQKREPDADLPKTVVIKKEKKKPKYIDLDDDDFENVDTVDDHDMFFDDVEDFVPKKFKKFKK